MGEISLDIFNEQENDYKKENLGKLVADINNIENKILPENLDFVLQGTVPVNKDVKRIGIKDSSVLNRCLNKTSKIEEPKQEPYQILKPKEEEPSIQEVTTQEPSIQEPKEQKPLVQELKIQEQQVQEPLFQETKVQEYKSMEAIVSGIEIPIEANELDYSQYAIPMNLTDNINDIDIDLTHIVDEIESNIKKNGLNYIIKDVFININKKSLEKHNLEVLFIKDKILFRLKNVPIQIEKYQSHIITSIVERINNSIKKAKESNTLVFLVNITLNNIPLLTDKQLETILECYRNVLDVKILSPSLVKFTY